MVRKIDRSLVILCSIIIGLGVVIPWMSLNMFYYRPGRNQVEEKTLANTPFADVASNESKVIIEGELARVPGNPSLYQTEHNLGLPEEAITQDSAFNKSVEFLKETRPGILNWSLQSTAEETTSFRFTFVQRDFRAFVVVNRFTGRITDYECRYLQIFDPVRLSKEEGEQIVLDFLQKQRYYLPPNARYTGDIGYDCGRYKRFIFQQYLDSMRIESSRIVIAVSSFSKRVSDFEYHWFETKEVSMSGIRDKNSVMASTALYFIGEPDTLSEGQLDSIQFTSAELALAEVEQKDNETIYRLTWFLGLSVDTDNNNEEIIASVDARSSDIYALRSSRRGGIAINEHLTPLSTVFLVGSAWLVGILSASLILVLLLSSERRRS